VGFLPLRKMPERLCGVGFTSVRFLMNHDNDRPRAVARPEDEARCCEAFQRRFPNNPNATLALSYRSLGEYLHTFHKRHRRSVTRSAKLLFAAGQIELVTARDPASLPALFDLYLDLERRSWKAKVGGHIALEHLRASEDTYHAWEARELRWLLELMPSPALARRAYALSVLPRRLRSRLDRLWKKVA